MHTKPDTMFGSGTLLRRLNSSDRQYRSFLPATVSSSEVLFLFGLVPSIVWQDFYFWQLFTYQFLHGGPFICSSTCCSGCSAVT
jgi:hypothetical protein